MKKYLFVLTVFALLQVSCSKDDNEPGFKEDSVFQESQFLGYWKHIQTRQNGMWMEISTMCEVDFIEFKTGQLLNVYSCYFLPETGTWTFNGKNILKYDEKNGTKYQLNLVEVSDAEIIAEVDIITIEGYEEKQTRKYKKVISTLDDYYKYFTNGYKVKDINNFTMMSINSELNILAGVKDNKLWIGRFDANSKEQIYEKKDREDFSFTKRIHMGYGQYETFNVNSCGVSDAYNDNLFKLAFSLSNEHVDYKSTSELWFSESGKKIDCENDNFTLTHWYNGSYVMRYYNSVACLSQDGDSILSGSEFYFPAYECELFPINYNYFITAVPSSNSLYFSLNRIIDDGNSSWSRNETKIEAEQSNFKYAITVVEKNTFTWTFNVDITEYSGKKHSHIVKQDVSGITDM
ncbi:MAG: hypothetical protein LBV72_04110 [Tannerella sp.]|jgi:hypothetical protein|nr:hypothetical protein [Tannerella sp.]